jgi:hypothetical protein
VATFSKEPLGDLVECLREEAKSLREKAEELRRQAARKERLALAMELGERPTR